MRKRCGSMSGLLIAGAAITSVRAEETPLPSIVILLADDLGYATSAASGIRRFELRTWTGWRPRE